MPASTSKYLTGDTAAINEFIDRFDVSRCNKRNIIDEVHLLMNQTRSSYLIAMVTLEIPLSYTVELTANVMT